MSGKISGKGTGMACTGDASKCANDGCSKPGVHLCSRCRGVKYCSAACQKVHWKQGGHKQECNPAGHPGVVTKTAAATAACAGTRVGSCVGTCIICLDSDPSPIQSGCACRGDAGLAHVECRAEAAAHRLKNSKRTDGWWECATCGQEFTGAMQLGLARAWWSRVQRLPEVDKQRLRAASNLASSLGEQGKLAEAEAMLRDLLPVQQRVFGPEHPQTLGTTMNLAIALSEQGKYAEAEAMLRDLLPVHRRVHGPEHPNTLMATNNLASTLVKQAKHAEAEAMLRESLPVQRRVHGPEHPNTLGMTMNLASTLMKQAKHAEAEVILRESLPVQRRVLGPEHPQTLMATTNLAKTLGRQAKYPEAEAMLRDLLPVQRRVLGPEHPQTLWTTKSLAVFKQTNSA
jgi:tetratricopeptide (TPR) repeat protein